MTAYKLKRVKSFWAAVLLLSSTGFGVADIVRFATEGAYPPYNFIDHKGEIVGFERDLGEALCDRAILTCEWVVTDYSSLIPNLISGDFDAVFSGIAATPEREALIDFTQQYTQPAPSAYITLKPDLDLDLAVVATQFGTSHAEFIAASTATLALVLTPEDAIDGLRNGTIDAFMSEKSLLTHLTMQFPDLKIIGADMYIGGSIGIGLRKGDDQLKAALNQAIQSMKDDGSLNELIEKWLPGSGKF